MRSCAAQSFLSHPFFSFLPSFPLPFSSLSFSSGVQARCTQRVDYHPGECQELNSNSAASVIALLLKSLRNTRLRTRGECGAVRLLMLLLRCECCCLCCCRLRAKGECGAVRLLLLLLRCECCCLCYLAMINYLDCALRAQIYRYPSFLFGLRQFVLITAQHCARCSLLQRMLQLHLRVVFARPILAQRGVLAMFLAHRVMVALNVGASQTAS